MLSKKIGIGVGLVIIFLTMVAFIIGRPESRDKRVYPIIREYTPFKIEKSLGGLKILRKDDPNFKEEPDALDFYKRVQYLEQEWAKKHLKLKNNRVHILDKNGTILKIIDLQNSKEKDFVIRYFKVKSE